VDEKQVGRNIRMLRESRGLSLTATALRAGMSKSNLSKIETAQVSSSIATLLTIAKALDVHMGRFFVESEVMPTHVLMRNGKAPLISRGGSVYGYSYEALALEMPEKLAEPFILTIRPSDKRGVFRHEGQEFNYILSGRVRITVGEESFVLEVGDSLYFDPRLPHSFEALDRKLVRLLLVFTYQQSSKQSNNIS